MSASSRVRVCPSAVVDLMVDLVVMVDPVVMVNPMVDLVVDLVVDPMVDPMVDLTGVQLFYDDARSSARSLRRRS